MADRHAADEVRRGGAVERLEGQRVLLGIHPLGQPVGELLDDRDRTEGGVPLPWRLRSMPSCQLSSIEVSVVCMQSMVAMRWAVTA